MTATLATAAVLIVPFLAVVLVGALAVAVHDAIARAWSVRATAVEQGSAAASARRSGAPRGAVRRSAAVLARPGAAPRRPVRRASVVLVR